MANCLDFVYLIDFYIYGFLNDAFYNSGGNVLMLFVVLILVCRQLINKKFAYFVINNIFNINIFNDADCDHRK